MLAVTVDGHGRVRDRRAKRGLLRKPLDLGLRAQPHFSNVSTDYRLKFHVQSLAGMDWLRPWRLTLGYVKDLRLSLSVVRW